MNPGAPRPRFPARARPGLRGDRLRSLGQVELKMHLILTYEMDEYSNGSQMATGNRGSFTT